MSDASLTAWLKLNGLEFTKGLDDAGKRTQRFSSEFKEQLGESRKGIKETQHAVVGMSEAMDGSFKGAVHAFKGFSGLLISNPVLAAVAAMAAAATFFIKRWEEAEIEYEKILDKLTTKAVAANKALRRAMGGERTPQEIGKEMAESAALSDNEEKIKQEEKIAELKKEQGRLEDLLNYRKSINDKKGVEGAVEELSVVEDNLKKESEIYDAFLKEKNRRELEYQANSTEHHNKRIEQIQKEAEEKKKADEEAAKQQDQLNKKNAEMYAKIEERVQKTQKDAQRKISDIDSRSFNSRFDTADQYARMGGTIGRQVDPVLRAADIQAQRQEETNKILGAMKEDIKSIRSSASYAMSGESQ